MTDKKPVPLSILGELSTWFKDHGIGASNAVQIMLIYFGEIIHHNDVENGPAMIDQMLKAVLHDIEQRMTAFDHKGL